MIVRAPLFRGVPMLPPGREADRFRIVPPGLAAAAADVLEASRKFNSVQPGDAWCVPVLRDAAGAAEQQPTPAQRQFAEEAAEMLRLLASSGVRVDEVFRAVLQLQQGLAARVTTLERGAGTDVEPAGL